MIIAICIVLLFIDTTLASADALRFERIQGHCSAWCLEEYGLWATTESSFPAEVDVYQCEGSTTQQQCNDCNLGCAYEWNNLRECYSRCSNNAACKDGCNTLKVLSRKALNMTELSIQMQVNYPQDIHEDADDRTTDTIGIKWSEVKQFDEPRSVVFLVFLMNITSETQNEDKSPQMLYMGSTPHHNYLVRPLNPDYCYWFRMISVTKDVILGGSATSPRPYSTNAVIHVDAITATSAIIWFRRRPCEMDHTYKVGLFFQEDRDENVYKPLERTITQDNENENIFRYEATDLYPNLPYRINVLRNSGSNEQFDWHEDFNTLRAPPQTTVSVKNITETSGTYIEFMYIVDNEIELWGEEPVFYLFQLADSQGSDLGDPMRIVAFGRNDGFHTASNLVPYTRYCGRFAVGNGQGAGPYGSPQCASTTMEAPPAPLVTVLESTAMHSTLRVTRPEPPKGKLTQYIVTYAESDEMKSVLYPIVEEADTQDIVVRSLDAHTTYRINVQAVNSEGTEGDPASVTFRTLQSYPDVAPNITTCMVAANGSHTSVGITWSSIEDDLLNGEITYYSVYLAQKQVDQFGSGKVLYNDSFIEKPQNLTHEVLQLLIGNSDISLLHTVDETIQVTLTVSTIAGSSPPSNPFSCSIAAASGTVGLDAVHIIVPVICVIAFFVILTVAFFYFFRFKTYKKTPYEEIKKLIRPDDFSPCHHCTHNKEPKKWDVFICHVSEDEEYTQKLKEACVRENIDVFFAKDELHWGCELHRVINEGLRDSKYGLVVLSKQFVSKCSKWTSSELSSLHSKSRLSSQDCILPIWKKDISEQDIADFDITLVGIKALKEEDMSVDQMATELKKKLRSSSTCWGCKSYELQWSTSDYSLDNSPVDSLHTTLL